MQLKNDRLLRALKREPVDKTPVWLMRQAGRYLPEYRAIRQKIGSFLTMCKTPEIACEITLQPINRFDLDAAIIYSDILTIPDAMGCGLFFEDNEGPRFKFPTQDHNSVKALPIPDPNVELRYVMDAIRLVKRELNGKVPLIGFAGSPWTIACYMVEGGASKNFSIIKKMLYDTPETMHLLLQKLSDSISLYLKAQIDAGVDVIMLFDTWGGILSTEAYEHFSLHYMRQILESLASTNIPTIVFTKGGGQWLEMIASSGCDAVGLDWTTDLKTARERVGNHIALQGNLDPSILLASPDVIQREVKKVLNAFGNHPGHIFNLGHGLTPNIPHEHVKVLIDAVHGG